MSDQNYSAEIKLALQDAVTPVLDKIDKRLGDLEKSFEKMEKSGTKAGEGASKSMEGLSAAAVATGELIQKSVLKALELVKSQMTAIYDATKLQEQLTLKMAATMAATNGWSNSIALASERLDELKQIGSLVNATESQMVDTFGNLKRTLGGTSDEVVKLVEKLTVLSAKSNASPDELANALTTAAMTGELRARSAGGKALINAGVDPKVLETMKEAGKAVEYLNGVLKGDPELVNRLKNSWSYLEAELSRTKDQAMETIGKGLEPLKKNLKDLIGYMDGPEFKGKLETFARALRVNMVEWQDYADSFGRLGRAIENTMSFLFGNRSFAKFAEERKALIEEAKKAEAEFPFKILSAAYPVEPGKPGKENPTGPGKALRDSAALQIIREKEKADLIKQQMELFGIREAGIIKEEALIKGAYDFEKQMSYVKFLEDVKNKVSEFDAREAHQKRMGVSEAKYFANSEVLAKRYYAQEIVDRVKWMDEVRAGQDQLELLQTAAYDKAQVAENQLYENNKIALLRRLALGEDVDKQLELEDQRHWAQMTENSKTALGAIQKLRVLNEESIVKLLNTGTEAAEGVQAAMLHIFNTLKTETEITFELITGMWSDLGSNIERSLQSGMKGNKNFLRDFFSGIADDFSKRLATSLKESLLNVINNTVGITTVDPVTGKVTTKANDANRSKYADAGFAALAGVGAASAAGTLMGDASPYLSAASAVAMIPAAGYQYIAAAVIAVVGLIASAMKDSGEKYAARFASGDAVSALLRGTPQNDTGQRALTLRNSIVGFFDDIFKHADPNFATSILKSINKTIIDWWYKNGPGTETGSAADRDANVKAIWEKMIPTQLMHAMFGQTPISLQNPGGITGFSTPWSPGRGNDPSNVSTYGKIDASSPLVRFLTDLGFSLGKVQEIADSIDVMAPEEFRKYFEGIVKVVVDFKNNIANLSQSWEQIQVAIEEANNPNVVKQFSLAGDGLVRMAEDLSLYTGQEQVDRATALNDAADNYYKSAFEAMRALKAFMDEMAKQAKSFQDAATSYMKTPQWRYNDFMNYTATPQPGPGYGEDNSFTIRNLAEKAKNDPKALNALWNDFIQQATASLNYLIGLWNQLNASLKTVKDLTKAFGDMDKALSRNVMDINTILSDLADYEGLLTQLSNLDPTSATYFDDVTALTQQVGQSLQSLYDEIYNFLQAVKSTQGSLNAGAASAIWNNNYAIAGNNDKSGTNGAQIGMIKSQIDADLAAIQSATDPGVVAAKSQDIYRLLGLYQGMFKPGDPNFNAAYQWANGVITQMQEVGNTTLDALGIQGNAAAKLLGPGGKDAVSAINLVEIAVGNVETAIEALTAVVTSIKDLFTGYTTGTVDSIITEMGEVAAALKTAMTLFTQALVGGGNTGPGGGPGGGPGTDTQGATATMNQLSLATVGAIGNETSGLNGVAAACNRLINIMEGA